MESNIEDLKKDRENVLDETIVGILNWDGSYEKGIKIVESVGASIEELKRLNKSLEALLGSLPIGGKYNEKMLILVEEYEDLLNKLDIERSKLLKLIQEVKLKEKVRDNYISKDLESIFIDKDL